MVAAVLKKYQTPPDLVLQVSDMVRVAVDNALKQLRANGGGAVEHHQGYQHAARTAEEIHATMASDTAVPRSQEAVTDGMADDLADIVNAVPEPEGEGPGIIVPKEGLRGWAF